MEKCRIVNFSDRFGSLMAGAKESQKDLAEAIGVSPGAIVNYKKGQLPKAEELLRLARHFGVTMEWLLTGEEGDGGGGLGSPPEAAGRTKEDAPEVYTTANRKAGAAAVETIKEMSLLFEQVKTASAKRVIAENIRDLAETLAGIYEEREGKSGT